MQTLEQTLWVREARSALAVLRACALRVIGSDVLEDGHAKALVLAGIERAAFRAMDEADVAAEDGQPSSDPARLLHAALHAVLNCLAHASAACAL